MKSSDMAAAPSTALMRPRVGTVTGLTYAVKISGEPIAWKGVDACLTQTSVFDQGNTEHVTVRNPPPPPAAAPRRSLRPSVTRDKGAF